MHIYIHTLSKGFCTENNNNNNMFINNEPRYKHTYIHACINTLRRDLKLEIFKQYDT